MQATATAPNQLISVITESAVEEQTGLTLKEKFLPFFEKAEEWKTKAASIVVTEASQKELMADARKARLFLKDIRVQADKTRKELKEDSIRYGKAVQGVYNVIEYMIVPIEEHLEKQEKFAEIQEAQRRDKLKAERELELQPYMEFVAYNLDLGGMGDDDYAKILNGAKLQMQAKNEAIQREEAERIERERIQEAERIAKEKADAEERERIRVENEQLRAEAEQREQQMRAEREKAEVERKALEAKAEEERRERLRIEAEASAKAEAERQAKAAEAARIKAEEAAKQAAPDIEKAKALAAEIRNIKAPEMATKAGRDKVARAMALLQQAVELLK